VFGNLPTFAADASDILQVLDVQHASVVKLLQNGGTVFSAIARDPATLRNLVTTGETTFNTTAANNRALAATFQTFPEFLTQTRLTMARLKTFSLDADPLVRELVPVAQQLQPTLNSVRQLSPPLENLFVNLRPLINASRTGLPAVASVLTGARPLLGALAPFLEQLNPVITWLSLHQQLTSDFFSNGASALATRLQPYAGGDGHALAQLVLAGPETLSFWQNRPISNRGNVYRPPIWGSNTSLLGSSIDGAMPPAWDCNNAGGTVPPLNVPLVGHPACFTGPNLGGLIGQPNNKFPHVLQAHYPSK
jgi:ABC-type transporter Mla subunit MlaD